MNSSLLNKLLSPVLSTPASNRNCNNIRCDDDNDNAASSSCFQRTVCLYDWWLVKAQKYYEGKRLAVAGFTSREQQAMRTFTSAPIVKRYDVFTLETADEICIVIKGFINKSRTMENGFSSEVFSHFMFGFPPYWEAYTEKFLGEEFMAGTGLFPNYNKAAADPEFAADAGMTNPNSNAIPRNHKVSCKHNAGDINKCSEYVSEKTTTNASNSSDSHSHATDHCDVVNTKNHVSKYLPPSTSRDIDNVSWCEDNLKVRAVLAIPSSYHVTSSSGRRANSKSRMKGNTGTVTKSKTEEKVSSKDITMTNAASGQSPVHKGSDVDNANPSNSDPAVSLGNSEVALNINSSDLKTNVLIMGLNVNKSSDLLGYVADHNDTGNTKNPASQNLPQSMNCDINNVSSLKDLAVPAEPSSYHITGSFERMVNAKSGTIGKTGTGTNSNPRERASSEDINLKNAASVESPLPTDSDVDNNNPSNLEAVLPLESSEVALRITSSGSKTSQKQKEIGKCRYGFYCENKNSPSASEPHESDGIVRCIGEKSHGVESSSSLNVGPTMMHKKSLFTSSVGGELNIPECVENHDDHTLFFSAVHSAVNVNPFTPSPVDTNTVNTIEISSGNKSSNCLRSLNPNQKRHSGFSDSVKHSKKNLIPEVFLPEDNLKRCSSHTTIHSGGKMDKLEATGSQSLDRNFRTLLESFRGKEKKKVSIVCGLTTVGSKIGFVSVLPDETGNPVKNNNVWGEPLKPSHSTSVKVNSEPGKGCKKKSQASSPRQNKNNLAKCRSGPGDMNHNCNSKTTVAEGERNVKVGSSREKARKKINFDAVVNACHLTPKAKENSSIVSPESLSLKRSRSGRLLVPSLDFWRNQIAIYDVDRKITGLPEGLEILKPSKGIPSETPNKKKQRA